ADLVRVTFCDRLGGELITAHRGSCFVWSPEKARGQRPAALLGVGCAGAQSAERRSRSRRRARDARAGPRRVVRLCPTHTQRLGRIPHRNEFIYTPTGMGPTEIIAYLTREGWPVERLSETTARSRFRGEKQSFRFFVHVDKTFLSVAVVPYI